MMSSKDWFEKWPVIPLVLDQHTVGTVQSFMCINMYLYISFEMLDQKA